MTVAMNAKLLGGWEIEKMEPCPLPEKLATGFVQAMEGFVGATYVPVLYCGKQIVSGTNYLLICKGQLTTKEVQETVVAMTLHETLPEKGHLLGTFSISNIERII